MIEPGSSSDWNQSHEPQPSPQKPQIWTRWFILLWALIILLGAAALIFSFLGTSIGSAGRGYGVLFSGLLAASIAALAVDGVFLVACLIGLGLVRNKLLLVSFALRTLVTAGSIFLLLVALNIGNIVFWQPVDQLFLSPLFLPLFNLSLGVLGVLGQITLSYGLARWQPSDNVFVWVQLFLTLGLGFVILESQPHLSGLNLAFLILITVGPFLAIAGIACLLLRPACWKASPLIVLCLTAGGVLSLLLSEVIFRLVPPPASVAQIQQIYTQIGIASTTLFILGLLLLIQREWMQKKAQTSGLAAQESV